MLEFGALDNYIPPVGSFNPTYGWEHHYRIWLVRLFDYGLLKLKCSQTSPEETGVLTVNQTVSQTTGSLLHTTDAEIGFKGDTLATPVWWDVDSVVVDSKPVEETRYQESAVVADGRIEVTIDNKAFFRNAPSVFTNNWLLFNVVQRLQGLSQTPLVFDLLEALDLLKKDQRLSFQETRSFDVNGYTLSLTGYHLIGKGILPFQFWVDDAQRLLFAFTGHRAYILETAIAERLRESWNSATLPQTFSPGSSGTVAGADNTWDYLLEEKASSMAITEESTNGNLRIESMGDGGDIPNLARFSSTGFTIDYEASGSVTVMAKIELNAATAKTGQQVSIMVNDGNPSMSGFGIRFTANTARHALSAHVVDKNVMNSVFCGGQGEQVAGEIFSIKVTFTRNGTDTVIDYRVEKMNGGDLIPPGTQTIAGASPPAGVILNKADLAVSHRLKCTIDDIIIRA